MNNGNFSKIMTFDIAYHLFPFYANIPKGFIFLSQFNIHSKRLKSRLYFEYNSLIKLLREFLNVLKYRDSPESLYL